MKQQVKKIVQQAAKQIAQEPLEVLKKAGEQVVGTIPVETKPQGQSMEKSISPQEVQAKRAKARSLYTALKNELQEIEAKKIRQQTQEVPTSPKETKPLVEPPTKRSRRLFNFGQKGVAERQKTHVERPVQSST